MDFEQMFQEEHQRTEPRSFADSIIEDNERRFCAGSDLEKEKKECRDQIAALKKKLRSYHNVKNHRKVDMNAKMAQHRKEIRAQILAVSTRLEELGMEEEGAQVSATKLSETAPEGWGGLRPPQTPPTGSVNRDPETLASLARI